MLRNFLYSRQRRDQRFFFQLHLIAADVVDVDGMGCSQATSMHAEPDTH